MRQLLASLFLTVAISASAQPSGTIGVLNYIEGQAYINGLPLAAGSGSITARLTAGETLTTDSGKAEVLLTPGNFLRVGGKSSVSITEGMEVVLNKGRATLEVADIPRSSLVIHVAGFAVRILEPGLYDFDAKRKQVHVFDGHAIVASFGSSVDLFNGQWVDLSAGDSILPAKFDEESFRQDDLYQWTSLRSAYLAEANANLAANYAQSGFDPGPDATPDPTSPGPVGWCWDATYDVYTFIPVGGIRYSPFGWGFYSSHAVYQAPPVVHRPDKWVPEHHRFDQDPGRWGAGFHYPIPARTVPVPANVTSPPLVRPVPRIPIPQPVSGFPGPAQPAPRVPQPVSGFVPAPVQSVAPVAVAPAQPARVASPPQPRVPVPAPVTSFHPAPPIMPHPSAPPAVHVSPPPATHVSPPPAPRSESSGAAAKKN